MLIKYLIILLGVATLTQNHDIQKRTLLATYQTVLQFSTGLTVPAVLPRRSINLSLVGQANYNMPYNLSNFHPKIVSARVEEKHDYFDISRKKFYMYIIEFLEGIGLDGEECLLRSVCEIAEYPMHIKEEETLLEKIVHYVFTPSLEFTIQPRNQSSDSDVSKKDKKLVEKLLLAEEYGQENGKCGKEYSDCIISLVDLFTAKYMID